MSEHPQPTSPRVLVVEHQEDAPPAWFGRWLVEAGAALDVRRPHAGEPLPDDLAAHDALVVLGGSMSATSDEVPWIAPTRELVRHAEAADVPTLGICLGHQLCAVALGGSVQVNPAGQELGVLAVDWQDGAGLDPLLGAVLETTLAVHWNDDVVATLPPQARVLARSPGGAVQAARFGASVWGLQLHPEVDEQIVAGWARADGGAREVHGQARVDAALAAIGAARAELHAGWRPVAQQLVDLARDRARVPQGTADVP